LAAAAAGAFAAAAGASTAFAGGAAAGAAAAGAAAAGAEEVELELGETPAPFTCTAVPNLPLPTGEIAPMASTGLVPGSPVTRTSSDDTPSPNLEACQEAPYAFVAAVQEEEPVGRTSSLETTPEPATPCC
jgi:hypothetical protein